MASRTSSKRTAANIAVQSLLGAIFFGIWVAVGVFVYEETTMSVVGACVPYAIFFELGILSRYVPGVKSIARRLDG